MCAPLLYVVKIKCYSSLPLSCWNSTRNNQMLSKLLPFEGNIVLMLFDLGVVDSTIPAVSLAIVSVISQ